MIAVEVLGYLLAILALVGVVSYLTACAGASGTRWRWLTLKEWWG